MSGQLPPQRLVDLGAEHIEEPDRNTPPLHNDIVTGVEHGGHLDAAAARPLAVLGVVLQTALFLLGLQRQNTKVNEESAVPVLGQAGEELLAGKLDLHDGLHGLHERVREPLSELVEGKDALPWCNSIGLAG